MKKGFLVFLDDVNDGAPTRDAVAIKCVHQGLNQIKHSDFIIFFHSSDYFVHFDV